MESAKLKFRRSNCGNNLEKDRPNLNFVRVFHAI